MLALVTTDNLLQMFFGWEGVGLASYLLIGFWYQKPSANAAAIKAFVVNRVGDFGFALGIFAVFSVFGSRALRRDLRRRARTRSARPSCFSAMQVDILTMLCLLLFMGAMGKSAQFLLHTWLPDAMEGPTPVSALIHAATMVTAGVFMVARLSPLFELAPVALDVVTLIGAITAFFAATVGLVQNDIKRVIAYSTCSQLGYMFVGLRRRRLRRRHLPPLHPRLLQGAAVPRRRLGDPRHASRAGHARDGRPCAKSCPSPGAMMLIGTLSLTGFPVHLGLRIPRTPIIEAAYAAHTPIGSYAFVLLGHRRAADGLLFLAPDLPDVLRQAARADSHDEHARTRHEPPMDHGHAAHAVLCARRAAAPARIFIDLHRRGPEPNSGAARSSPMARRMHEVPLLVMLRRRSPCCRLRDRLVLLHPARSCRFGLAERFRRSTCSCSTSGTSTSSTTSIFVRPAMRLGHFLWKAATARSSTASALTASRRASRRHRPRRQAADRLHLPLRLRDADRGRAAHHLFHLCRGRLLK